jgi:hypothetical protein
LVPFQASPPSQVLATLRVRVALEKISLLTEVLVVLAQLQAELVVL